MERDINIDVLRGVTMLYIIFVIHGLCWFGFVPINSLFFSLLLFEMPVIFYISGAALKLSKRKPFTTYLKSRILRVVIPYVVWAIITILILSFVGDIKCDWKNIVLCKSLNSIPYVWHVWFIYPYLIISILGFFLLKAFQKFGYIFLIIYVSCSVIAMAVLDVFELLITHDIIRSILVYSVFFVYGFTYKESKYNIIHISCAILFIVAYISLIVTHLYPYYTQSNKFPPNLEFLFFGGIAVSAVALFLPRIRLNGGGILLFANKYGFELYLYQNYAMWIYAIIRLKYFTGLPIIFQYLLCIIFVTIILFPIAFLMNKLDNKLCKILNPKNE